jgi:hypothetical protein
MARPFRQFHSSPIKIIYQFERRENTFAVPEDEEGAVISTSLQAADKAVHWYLTTVEEGVQMRRWMLVMDSENNHVAFETRDSVMRVH